MKIAVSYDGGEIGAHFGHAECFAIYNYENEDVNNCSKTLIDASALHGHQQMADLMKKNNVDAVICQKMGGEAKALLLSYGIIPVTGYQGDADTASDMLITGTLPITEGGDCSCSGGCGGGCCGHDEGGSCGCGGGCEGGCH